MSPEIFEKTRLKVDSLFRSSPLSKKSWGYSISATPLSIGKPLIMGINWGGGARVGANYTSQMEMPTQAQFDRDLNAGDYDFLTRSSSFLLDHLTLDIYQNPFNYSNLCFFRTPKLKDLSWSDRIACAHVFREMVLDIKPKWILSLSSCNLDVLGNSGVDALGSSRSKDPKGVRTYKGNLWGFDFYSVPHPGARLKASVRKAAWNAVCPIA